MNIVINKQEHERLLSFDHRKRVMGSHLYGTNTQDSDLDYLCIYEEPNFWEKYQRFPNVHQFQYKDIEHNIDYIWTSWRQFYTNQRSGDSTINTDLIMFDPKLFGWGDIGDKSRLEMCRTYKVIKAFLGFAKRDLKAGSDHKITHAERSMYCAEELLNGRLPKLGEIQRIYGENRYNTNLSNKITGLLMWNKTLRSEMNSMYEKGELKMYHIPKTSDPLLNKLLESNNTKEFKYV